MAAQIINMPVWVGGNPGMMRHPRTQSTGAERAANINAITRRQKQFAQPTNTQGQRFRDCQPQSVSARMGR